MKIKNLIYLAIAFGFLVSCKKENNNTSGSVQYQNASKINSIDTTFGIFDIPITSESVSYDLDIDLDGSVDLSFIVSIDPDYEDFKRTVSIKTLNNFEFAVQNSYELRESNFNANNEETIDSVIVEIPKICKTLDTVSTLLSFKSNLTKLAYMNSWTYNSYDGDNYISGFSDLGVKYIGIRNEITNVLCWVKFEVKEYKSVKIISYYYTVGDDFLVIDE